MMVMMGHNVFGWVAMFTIHSNKLNHKQQLKYVNSIIFLLTLRPICNSLKGFYGSTENAFSKYLEAQNPKLSLHPTRVRPIRVSKIKSGFACMQEQVHSQNHKITWQVGLLHWCQSHLLDNNVMHGWYMLAISKLASNKLLWNKNKS